MSPFTTATLAANLPADGLDLGFAGATMALSRELSAEQWAKTVVCLTFGQPMINNAALALPGNYTMTGLRGASGLIVNRVLTTNRHLTNQVWLVVTPPVVGQDYIATASGIRASTGAYMTSSSGYFRGRRTKIDSAVVSRQPFMEVAPGSLHRSLLDAWMRQDDLQGGERKDPWD